MSLSNEYIVALQCTKGVGATTVSKVCDALHDDRCGITSIGELFDFMEDRIKSGYFKRMALPEFDELESGLRAAHRIMRLSEELGIGMISRYEENFPKMLLGTVDESGKSAVPTLLYFKGDLTVTQRPALAVIGTREPSPAGTMAGEYYASAFAAIGVNIVSGLALGCDTTGHRGALNAGGVTTAFLAHGLDSIYPQENTDLAREIVDRGGLLMSEYPVGTWVNRYNLVARDRLQAGLSDATLVVQTGIKGGTMHAVRATQASGKPLFVVDYKDNQGEKAEGNAFLKAKGAVGIRNKKEDILANPEKYIALIKGLRAEAKEAEEPFKDTLF